MTKKKYSFEDHPEHRAMLPAWRDKWVKNALSTAQTTAEDRERIKDTVERLYAAADLKPPERSRIVIVSSPLIARFAGGFASWLVEGNKAVDASPSLTFGSRCANETYAATRAAYGLKCDPVVEQDESAAYKDDSRWYRHKADFPAVAAAFGDPKEMLNRASQMSEFWSGGNQTSAWCAYISFFRHVAKLPIDYTKWAPYEDLALMSGPRIVHEKFCIVSERPSLLLVDDRNQPHCDDGPFCRWRDGFELFSIHGVRIPAYVVMNPECISVEAVKAEGNAETRRVMREKFGEGRYLLESGAKLIDYDYETAREGAAPRALMEYDDGERVLVGTDGSTQRVYYMPVESDVETCRKAHESLCGFDESKIITKS